MKKRMDCLVSELATINESADESVLFREVTGGKNHPSGFILLVPTQEPNAANFSDLSSIDHVGQDLLEAFNFVPKTGAACMDSIPLAIQLLN